MGARFNVSRSLPHSYVLDYQFVYDLAELAIKYFKDWKFKFNFKDGSSYTITEKSDIHSVSHVGISYVESMEFSASNSRNEDLYSIVLSIGKYRTGIDLSIEGDYDSVIALDSKLNNLFVGRQDLILAQIVNKEWMFYFLLLISCGLFNFFIFDSLPIDKRSDTNVVVNLFLWSAIFSFASSIVLLKIAKFLYPRITLKFGMGERLYLRRVSYRNFLVGTIFVGVLVGVFGNIISDIIKGK